MELTFNEKDKYEFDFVIGADGNRSTVRSIIIGDDDPEFAGYIAWRGLVPTSELSESDFDECGSSAFIAPGRVFARYLVRNGELYNYVAFLVTDEWAEEGWAIPSDVEIVMDIFSDYNQQVKNIIKATQEMSYSNGEFLLERHQKTGHQTILLFLAMRLTPSNHSWDKGPVWQLRMVL